MGMAHLIKKFAVPNFLLLICFPRTCAGEKHTNPPYFPQKIGETGPQAGVNSKWQKNPQIFRQFKTAAPMVRLLVYVKLIPWS